MTQDHEPTLAGVRAEIDKARRWVSPADIENWVAYHPATPITGAAHDAVRVRFGDLMHWLNDTLPEGPEKTTALNKLREGMFWSNHLIATRGADHDFPAELGEAGVPVQSWSTRQPVGEVPAQSG